jgi:hypothetical protein
MLAGARRTPILGATKGGRMESLVSRAKGIMLEPRATWKEVDTEFTKPGEVWGKYILPLAAIGAIARAVGILIFGKPIAFTSLTNPVSVQTGVVSGIVTLVVSLVSVFALTKIISLMAPGFGGQRNDVQALKVAAYSSTATWVGGIFTLVPALNPVFYIVSLYSLVLMYLGLPILMKVPQDRAMGYTAVVIIISIVVFLIQIAIVTA